MIMNSSHLRVSVGLLENYDRIQMAKFCVALFRPLSFLVSGSIDYLSPNCFSISELIYLMTRSSVYGSHLNTKYPLYTTFDAVCGRLLESVTVPFENGV